MSVDEAQLIVDQDNTTYFCQGSWSISKLDKMLAAFATESLPEESKLSISGEKLTHFDSAGALALSECITKLETRHNQVELIHFNIEYLSLLDLIKENDAAIRHKVPEPKQANFLYRVGKESINKLKQGDGFVILIGEFSINFFEACADWRRFQFPSIVSIIYTTGIQALPILALLSFLIGVVLAYQMGLQLQTYGANILIAYLSGMAIFREFAPLITAIIVAGRTSSSFTAQIGSMKINEEIDALYTMGLSPVELLVVPKVLGLLLVFPLIIFWSDVFSVLGSMYMSRMMLNVGFYDFLTRLQESVGLKQLMLGLYKAPAFAIIIALVGCFQGFLVEASADSVGSQTTKSVVQALFLIIIADAIYSVAYSWMGL